MSMILITLHWQQWFVLGTVGVNLIILIGRPMPWMGRALSIAYLGAIQYALWSAGFFTNGITP